MRDEICEVWNLDNTPCDNTDTVLYILGCVHEHIRETWICTMHSQRPGYCGDCLNATGQLVRYSLVRKE